jgi:hypothetical protein
MAKITPTQNTSSQNQDPLVIASSATGHLKLADPTTVVTPTGADYPAAAHFVSPVRSATTTITAVAAGTAAGGTVLASNTSRRGASIYNNSTAICYLALGTAAASTRFTVALAASSYYEVPFQYTGIITGSWVAANGSAFVTEVTA